MWNAKKMQILLVSLPPEGCTILFLKSTCSCTWYMSRDEICQWLLLQCLALPHIEDGLLDKRVISEILCMYIQSAIMTCQCQKSSRKDDQTISNVCCFLIINNRFLVSCCATSCGFGPINQMLLMIFHL